MLKMAFCAFKIFRDNIWKMTPCWPPPPKIWNFPYVLSLFFLKASLRSREMKDEGLKMNGESWKMKDEERIQF